MFANRFTAILDANVIVPSLKRNMLLSLAEAEFFRPRWSKKILDETERAIEKIREKQQNNSNPAGDARRAREAMEQAFDDAIVTGFEPLECAFENLPDPDDAHVIAAAIKTNASIIVTDNTKHFPADFLLPYGLEAKTANEFLADTIDLKPEKAAIALGDMRRRLKRSDLSANELILIMEARGLSLPADALRNHIDFL